MKKLLILPAFLLVFSLSASAYTGWYFRPAKPRPIIYGGEKWIEQTDALYMGGEGDKKVYLTFDAGYGNENTEKIIDILIERNVPSAFFILPQFAKTNSDDVKRLYQNGHFICNHSYSHGNMSGLTKSQLQKELVKAEEYVFEQTGVEMKKYFRPPEGAFSKGMLQNLSDLGYTAVFWSNAYADWDNQNQKSPEYAYNKIMDNLHDGMVLLLHPNSKTNADILERVIDGIYSAGYTFGTLDELLLSQKG